MGHSAVSAVKLLLFPDDQTNQLKGSLPKVFSELSDPYNVIFSGEKKKTFISLICTKSSDSISPTASREL